MTEQAGSPDMGRALEALADERRRRLLDRLARAGALSATVLAEGEPVSRQAVAKHLAVLQEARLVASERRGRETVYRVRSAALREVEDWLGRVADEWDASLALLRHRAEG